ncbi:MAG: UDP-N-acetylmuramoyl-L-alanyl-D-glutamate--2,6-diaminopimelate ligase [Alphaproteobacteria bacterium]|nr:UDP-N-acetylmuramoyl-L-alanyl-D-glutamate--2,6-diaminopimelate ligase [Alphaproteobacteria bacterium]
MRLSELIAGGPSPATLPSDPEIVGLSADSRAVKPGYLFAALAGTRQKGSDFIADAVRHGAVAVLAAPDAAPAAEASRVALVADPNPRRRLALMAAQFYGPQPKTIAAVTGTNGKTSVAAFTRQIWLRLGYRAATIGTLGVIADEFTHDFHHTTPDPVSLHEALAGLAKAGIDHLALEASSHGLDQCRLDGVVIGAAAFTNLTRDHFDYHPTVEAYFKAKARLFEVLLPSGGTAVLNADIDEAAALETICRARRHRLLRFGAKGQEIKLLERRDESGGQALKLEVLGLRRDIFLPLPGTFQASNVLASLGLAIGTGEKPDAALGTLEALRSVRGRLELVGRHSSGAPVYVDYAHTPDGIETVLRALRPYASRHLGIVFGCGGDRDKGKRPLMGQIAAKFADRAIVTDDNPRTEEAAAIRAAILAACPKATEIGDRRQAIEAAIAALEAGDALVIAGKGHEAGQIVGATVIPFDDASVARNALRASSGEILS